MNHVASIPGRHLSVLRQPPWWLGLALVGIVAGASIWLSSLPVLQGSGLSALTLAIVLGMLLGNTVFPALAPYTSPGVDFSKGILLRAGIILFGFRITFQEIADIGLAGIVIAAVMVALVFALALVLGTRLLGLDRETAMLIGAGSAICGAAAVVATNPVVKGESHKVTVAVATVVVFGTVSMFLYPLLFPYLGFNEHQFGVFVGSTVHEVAQVVAAGKAVSDVAESTAVIEKMLRVMMLAPFLLLLSAGLARTGGSGNSKAKVVIPWFAVLFIAASAINSTQWLPAALTNWLIQLDTLLLAMAMAALGLRTHVAAVRQAGARPLLLAAMLFACLLFAGYGVNKVVLNWL